MDVRGFAWSRAAKPWQGGALEGSGGSGARLWTSAALHGKVLTFALESRETVAGACSIEGSGGSGARFWTSAVLRGKVITFALEGRETVAGGCSIEGSGGSDARFWTSVVLRGRVPTFALERPRNRGRGVLWRALAVAALAFGRPRFCVERSSLWPSRTAKPWQGRAL